MRFARHWLYTTNRSDVFWSRVMIRTTLELTLAGLNSLPNPVAHLISAK
jgi:hypothetical protein